MEEKKFEKTTVSEKLSIFVEGRRVVFIAVLVAAVLALIGFAVFTLTKNGSVEKNLSKIDQITYELTKDSVSLSEEDLESRRIVALEALSEFVNKSGVVGVRANMLAAEITYSQKKFDSALDYWLKACAKGKKSYSAPLNYFNAAVCCEELNDLDKAIDLYKKACAYEDFALKSNACFNLGRVQETKGLKEDALETYKKLVDDFSSDSFASLAKSRIIVLEAK